MKKVDSLPRLQADVNLIPPPAISHSSSQELKPPLRRKNSKLQEEFLRQAFTDEQQQDEDQEETITDERVEYVHDETMLEGYSAVRNVNQETRYASEECVENSHQLGEDKSRHQEYDSIHDDSFQEPYYPEHEKNAPDQWEQSFDQPVQKEQVQKGNELEEWGGALQQKSGIPSDDLPASSNNKIRTAGTNISRRYATAMSRTRKNLFRASSLGHAIFQDLSSTQIVAYLLMIFAILSECGLPSPKYNFPVGAALLSVPHYLRSGNVVIVGLLLTIVMDIFWLLRPTETSYLGTFTPRAVACSRLTLATCLVLKLWMLFSVYFYLHPTGWNRPASPTKSSRKNHFGATSNSSLWNRWKFFFPRQTLPRRANLSYEVAMRVMALLWIHLICGIVLFFLSGVSFLVFWHTPHFQDRTFGMSLPIAMLLKAVTILSTFSVAMGNVHFEGCLRVFDCHKAGCVTRADLDRRKKKPVVKYTKKWSKRVKWMKVFDTFCGIYLALVVYASVHQSVYYTPGITVMLALVEMIVLTLDIWSCLLILVIYRCAKSLHYMYQHGTDEDIDVYMPEQLEHTYADNFSEEDSDEDSDSSDDNDSESSNSSDDVQIELTGNDDDDSIDWTRHFDEYGRAYLLHSETGETVWDWDKSQEDNNDIASDSSSYFSTASHAVSQLSNDAYITMEEFNTLWDRMVIVGDFQCRIQSVPTIDQLSEHLAINRFWVLHDVLHEEGRYYSVYFYATKADKTAHFLSEFVFDKHRLELHVTFKSEEEVDTTFFVRCLALKSVIGNYAPLEI